MVGAADSQQHLTRLLSRQGRLILVGIVRRHRFRSGHGYHRRLLRPTLPSTPALLSWSWIWTGRRLFRSPRYVRLQPPDRWPQLVMVESFADLLTRDEIASAFVQAGHHLVLDDDKRRRDPDFACPPFAEVPKVLQSLSISPMTSLREEGRSETFVSGGQQVVLDDDDRRLDPTFDRPPFKPSFRHRVNLSISPAIFPPTDQPINCSNGFAIALGGHQAGLDDDPRRRDQTSVRPPFAYIFTALREPFDLAYDLLAEGLIDQLLAKLSTLST
jgi:hypothetical protein